MNAKESILDQIRNTNKIAPVDLPEYEDYGIVYENKFNQFKTMIQSVGGHALTCKKESLNDTISNIYDNEKVIACNVQECSLGNFDPNEKNDAHDLKEIDLAIVKGEFAVAENGAVWIKNEQNRHRSLYFIAQNIVIVLSKDALVNNMHEAYENISFEEQGYGTFVSGPSKTADIEQSLVIGAHGPKSGYVIFVE